MDYVCGCAAIDDGCAAAILRSQATTEGDDQRCNDLAKDDENRGCAEMADQGGMNQMAVALYFD
jgi:hypothetical protein